MINRQRDNIDRLYYMCECMGINYHNVTVIGEYDKTEHKRANYIIKSYYDNDNGVGIYCIVSYNTIVMIIAYNYQTNKMFVQSYGKYSSTTTRHVLYACNELQRGFGPIMNDIYKSYRDNGNGYEKMYIL